MFVIRLLVVILFSKTVWANTLRVSLPNRSFVLSYAKDYINIKGYLLDLSFRKTKCNKSIIKGFNKKIKKLLQFKLLSQPKDYVLTLTWNKKKFYMYYNTKTGKELASLPRAVKHLKLIEKYKCGSKLHHKKSKPIKKS